MREYRKKIGLSQKEVAAKLEITQQAYGQKENGRRKFTIDELFKLEEIFMTDVYEMVKKIRK